METPDFGKLAHEIAERVVEQYQKHGVEDADIEQTLRTVWNQRGEIDLDAIRNRDPLIPVADTIHGWDR